MAAIDSAEVFELAFDQITLLAQEKKAQGFRFANIHAVRKEGGFDLYYTYVERQGHAQNYRVRLKDGQKVPSISPIFISAFFFENETHDLFGVPFEGIAVDYKGTFYQVAMGSPMNPDYKEGEILMDNPNFTAYQSKPQLHADKDERKPKQNQVETQGQSSNSGQDTVHDIEQADKQVVQSGKEELSE